MRLLFGTLLALALAAAPAHAATWKAGTAKADITPTRPIWMAGYGGRTAPGDGALHPLWAKALALEDASGKRAVIVSTDTLGMTRPIYESLKRRLARDYQLRPDQIQLNASHTHTGPVLRGGLYDIYPLNEKRLQVIEAYSQRFEDAIVRIVGEALKKMEPVTLRHGVGITRFGVNRRENPAGEVPARILEQTLKGPFDHDVPVLAAYRGTELKAVVFGYACHSTTLGIQQFTGDYSGWAQIDLEKSHPGAMALFSAGCGGDINPLPRREIRYAERYGHMLAAAVEETLLQKNRVLEPRLKTSLATVPLEFDALPPRETLESYAKNPNHYRGRWARRMLKLQQSGGIEKTYPYPIQVWQLGDLLWIALGGEVVVDYSIKFKKLFGPQTWVTAYCNDVMAYIPSLRVLKEGGYEGQSSMAVYGLPADRWKPNIEDLVTAGVTRLVRQTR